VHFFAPWYSAGWGGPNSRLPLVIFLNLEIGQNRISSSQIRTN